MIRARVSTILTTMSLTLSLTAVSGALPAPTLAALANVGIGGGTTAGVPARAATPTQVSPGNVAGFYVWVRNDDAANLSTFFMNAMSAATPIGAYFTKTTGGATGPYTNCPIDGGKLGCTFGAFNSGDVLQIVAAFRIPSTASDANCKPGDAPADPIGGYRIDPTHPSVCVDFRFGSNAGFVPGKNKSRGDDYHFYDFVTTDVGIDGGAGFPFCNQALPAVPCDTDLLTVFNAGHASRSDVQTTSVTAPTGAFNSAHGSTGIAVQDNFPFSCQVSETLVLPQCAAHEGTGPEAFVGQWSDVDVNSEQDFSEDGENGEFIRIDIEMYGVNANSIDGVVHVWFADGEWHEEVITAECPSADGPAEGQTSPCFWASGNGNVANVSIWAYNNGNWRTI